MTDDNQNTSPSDELEKLLERFYRSSGHMRSTTKAALCSYALQTSLRGLPEKWDTLKIDTTEYIVGFNNAITDAEAGLRKVWES